MFTWDPRVLTFRLMSTPGLSLSKHVPWEVQQETLNKRRKNTLHNWWCFQPLVVLEDRNKAEVMRGSEQNPWGGGSESFLPDFWPRGVGVQGEADTDQGLLSQTKACRLPQGCQLIALSNLSPFTQGGTYQYHFKNPKSKQNITELHISLKVEEQPEKILGLCVAQCSDSPRGIIHSPWKASGHPSVFLDNNSNST